MEEQDKEQKTEEATSKRLTDTEEKGNFAHSRELTSAFILLMATMAFFMGGSFSTRRMLGTWQHLISTSHSVQPTVSAVQELMLFVMENILVILSPLLLSIMLGGILANLIQTGGFKFSLHPLSPKFNKLNPLTGVKRIFQRLH